MQLHLFSDSGEPFLAYVIEASREILAGAPRPKIAYLPAASVGDEYLLMAQEALGTLGEVVTLDADAGPPERLAGALEDASVLFMPGGNTYLLSQRLQKSGLFKAIGEKVRAGLPLVGVSAGSVMCGLNILTTNDMNCCATAHFDGLGLIPYNLNVHYPDSAGPARDLRIERLWEFHHFFEQPVILLEDSAWLRVDEAGSGLARGSAWRFERGQDAPAPIAAGTAWPH